jgi:hypothetical protein
VAGVSAGLAAMYFLDPEQGPRRRAMFMDQVQKYSRMSGEWLNGTMHDLRNRSEGLAIEARKAVQQARGAKRSITRADDGVMDSPGRQRSAQPDRLAGRARACHCGAVSLLIRPIEPTTRGKANRQSISAC